MHRAQLLTFGELTHEKTNCSNSHRHYRLRPSPGGLCGARHSLATSVMDSRQIGVPMPEVMAIAEGLPAMENMAMEAYSKPRMRYEANKQDVITDFANAVYLTCLEEYK